MTGHCCLEFDIALSESNLSYSLAVFTNVSPLETSSLIDALSMSISSLTLPSLIFRGAVLGGSQTWSSGVRLFY